MYSGQPHTNLQVDDGQSYLEDPPETPAPLFAVRAFKTAMFGTPHPNQDDESNNEKRQAGMCAVETNQSLTQDQPLHETPQSLGLDIQLNNKPKIELLASPAKGILLTPGTAATRKKTVSFGGLADNLAGEKQCESDQIKTGDGASGSDEGLFTTQKLRSKSKNHSNLTKTLFKAQLEASKKRLSVEADHGKSELEASSGGNKHHLAVGAANESGVSDSAADTTVDLSQPRSRSGQHWKAEYELYHKNTAREMKKIIKHGQNVKSYALKKDSEATALGEKLKKELCKVDAMEVKVSQLATQLANARQSGSGEGGEDQSKLMGDLAKQTALAVRHKQKAEGYRRTIETNESLEVAGRGWEEQSAEQVGKDSSQKRPSTTVELNVPLSELFLLRSELENFKENVKSTEERAAQLEAENMTLKRSLARVKEEMNSYEKRRLAREQRLKTRETRLKQENQEYERNLAETTRECKRLLSETERHCKDPGNDEPLVKQSRNHGDAVRPVEPELWERGILIKDVGPADGSNEESVQVSPKTSRHQESACPGSRTRRERPMKPPLRDMAMASSDDAERKSPKLPPNRQIHKAQTSEVDVWMIGSPGDAAANTSLSKGLTQSSHFDLLRKEANDALQEIDQNLVLESSTNNHSPSYHQGKPSNEANLPPKLPRLDSSVSLGLPSCEPSMSSAVRRMHERRLNISSPRPSIVSFASSPPQQGLSNAGFQPARAADGNNREQRYSSIASSSTRASTMTSAKRRSVLPADRAAAAKARLQRRSMEKQKLRDRSKGNAGS